MADKPMKRYVITLVPKGMQIRITVRYHYISIKIAKLEKLDVPVLVRLWYRGFYWSEDKLVITTSEKTMC